MNSNCANCAKGAHGLVRVREDKILECLVCKTPLSSKGRTESSELSDGGGLSTLEDGVTVTPSALNGKTEGSNPSPPTNVDSANAEQGSAISNPSEGTNEDFAYVDPTQGMTITLKRDDDNRLESIHSKCSCGQEVLWENKERETPFGFADVYFE